MKNILETTALILAFYISVGVAVIMFYAMGGDGSDMLSQHYRQVINLIF